MLHLMSFMYVFGAVDVVVGIILDSIYPSTKYLGLRASFLCTCIFAHRTTTHNRSDREFV